MMVWARKRSVSAPKALLVLQRHFVITGLFGTSFEVAGAGDGLVMAAPDRPVQPEGDGFEPGGQAGE